MKQLFVSCTDGYYDHGSFVLENNEVRIVKNPTKHKFRKKLPIDSAFCNYLIRELFLSDLYRNFFTQHFTENYQISILQFYLLPTKYNLIDYNWNQRVYMLVRERCELDHALSWLSTLGGAFSALGDYFANCAETAGKISFHQLQLALRLGDPSIASRCRLYLSLSLIQKKKYKQAKWIIENEYHNAKRAAVTDTRLLNMCRGIWSKLKYEYFVYRTDIQKQVLLNFK